MYQIYYLLHEFVINLTRILMTLLELTGAAVIIHIAVVSFIKWLKLDYQRSSTEIRIRFGRGVALGLLFYLSAEILRLVTIRDYADLFIVSAIIILHVIVSILVAWEVSHSLKHVQEEEEYDEHCENC